MRFIWNLIIVGVASLLMQAQCLSALETDRSVITKREMAQIIPSTLQCEYLTDPIQIDIAKPVLSWQFHTDQPVQNQYQTAYQILVASSLQKLNDQAADLWDSGKVLSASNHSIAYAGPPLESRQKCWWKLRVWDQDNKPSPWSQPAFWQMALMRKSDWDGAQWIGLAEDSRNTERVGRPVQTRNMTSPQIRKSFASPMFRKPFTVRKPVRAAYAYICGLGYYELFLNGSKVGDRLLDPAQTSYDVVALYATYDITPLVKTGDNVVGAAVGNGFYGQNIGFVPGLAYGPPRMIALIHLDYTDGTSEQIRSATDWKATTGPYVFDNVYAGQTYDARLEMPGWNQPGFDDSAWENAKVMETPARSLRSQMISPIRAIKTLPVQRILPGANGSWIVDLGQNIAGWIKLTVSEPKGTQIKMTYAEHVMPDMQSLNVGSTGVAATGVVQTDIYICKGAAKETWQPNFTYHGFQYVQIEGLHRQPSPNDIQGVLVHTDMPVRGSFSCSDALLNQMYKVSLWTIVDNMHGLPEDCPHRERCGWLGDAHITAVTNFYNFAMNRIYAKYLRDIKSVMGRGGRTYLGQKAQPGIPCNIAPGKRLCQESRVDWGSALILLPWYQYVYTGDASLCKTRYADMKRFIKYIESFESADGIIENGYGDWCPPKWSGPRLGDPMECHPYVSSTAIYYMNLRVMRQIAAMMDDGPYADYCLHKSKTVKANFNRNFLKSIENTDALTYGSQTGNVLALQFGLVPQENLDALTAGLVYDIQQRHDGHHSCGIHGARYLYSVLCDTGYDALAYQVMTTPEFPSLAYVLNKGMTTWPERQMPLPDPGTTPHDSRSYNHPMQSGFAAFFHETVGGIRPDPNQPGFQHILFKPHLLNQLSWAKAQTRTPNGWIKSHWRRSENDFVWTVEVPVNSSATIYLPLRSQSALNRADGQVAELIQAGAFSGVQNNHALFKVGSGRYHLKSPNYYP